MGITFVNILTKKCLKSDFKMLEKLDNMC